MTTRLATKAPAGNTASAIDRAWSLSRQFSRSAAEHDRAGKLPVENFKALADAGLLSLTVPRDAGGEGAGLALAAEVIGILARGEPSTALVLAMHYINHAVVILNWPASFRDRLRRDSLAGGGLINALRVEPELGTPARGGLPATIARRGDGGWSLSGHKIYSTGIPVLGWLAVWARTDEADPRTGAFLVPTNVPGIEIRPTWRQLGMRATESHDVILNDVQIPLDHAVDVRRPTAWARADGELAWTTLLIGALYDGIARAAQDWLAGFLRSRVPSNLGASLATLPRVQEAMGEIEALLIANRRLLRSVAEDADRGLPPASTESGIVKSIVTTNAIAAVEIALKLTGNHGLAQGNPLERHYRDVLCGRIHTPQDDVVRIAAGKLALSI